MIPDDIAKGHDMLDCFFGCGKWQRTNNKYIKTQNMDVMVFLSFSFVNLLSFISNTIVLSAVNVKRVDFLDPIPPIQAEVDKLRAQNVNKIFVLGHGGYELDQKIAKTVKGIDVVVGGHSHTFLYTGESTP